MADTAMTRQATTAEIEVERYPLWTYGCNDHLDLELKDLPAGFSPCGQLKQDFPKLCKAVGALPHPSFKIKPLPQRSRRPSMGMSRRLSMSRRPSVLTGAEGDDAKVQQKIAAECTNPVLSVRSVLLDRVSMQVLALVLPVASHVKSICFSDCRLDGEMLQLLRRGLQEPCTVEALQIEWNPLDLPLPEVEDMEAADAAAAEAGGEQPGPPGSAGSARQAEEGAAGRQVDLASFEARERRRYRLQSERCLRSFRSWITDLCGGSLEAVWEALASTPADKLLSASDFHDLMETGLGAVGPQIAETFEVLDGPDYAAGTGQTSVAELRAALEGLPEEPEGSEASDPIGSTFAEFFDGECVLENVSFRACSIGMPDIVPMAEALGRCPWQLRSLNLWDNRICDRGAHALAEALDKYRGLEYLGLGRNRISDAGLAAICRLFQAVNLDEAGKQAAQARIKDQEATIEAKAKAQAKAKAAPKPTTKREPILFVDELEERPPVVEGGEPSYVLRRPSELQMLIVSENPIKQVRTLETLQPLGPKGVELLVKQTAAGAALLAKRPELATKERRPFCPGGEGWVVRVA